MKAKERGENFRAAWKRSFFVCFQKTIAVVLIVFVDFNTIRFNLCIILLSFI